MCMLCVIPPNVIPSREKLENSALNNGDGFGFAIVVPKEQRIIVERTMNADESINNFLKLRGEYPEGYAMWHARLATHGSECVENCHPFMVNSPKTYLAHNGVLSVLVDEKKDDRSDTRIFAEDVIAKIGVWSLDNPQIYNIIEEFTSGSKVCILTVDPRAKQQMYIFHQEKGKFDESGVWWSNDSCELNYYRGWSGYTYGGYAYKTGSKWYDDEYPQVIGGAITSHSYTSKTNDYACVSCMAQFPSEEMEQNEWICPFCLACQMCDQDKLMCLCYRPKDKSYSRKYEELNEIPQDTYDKIVKSIDLEPSYNFQTHKWEAVKVENEPTSAQSPAWEW